MHTRLLILLALAALLPLATLATRAQDAPAARRVSGVVRNHATGLFLRDAAVELHPAARPAGGVVGGRPAPVPVAKSATTDELGRFSFPGLAPGDYTIVVSYIGLEPFQKTVTLGDAVPAAEIDVQLTDPVYHLETFVVSGEREGAAAAINRQRLSDNIKTIAALDTFGILPNEDPSDLLIRLPGVNSEDAGGGTLTVRGIDSSRNLVTYDGAQMATSFGMISRQFRFLNISATSFEELEVIKAPTPDLWASSLGGTINMKTKTTLNMREDLLFTYRAGFKLSPSFFNYIPRRADHPFGPLAALGYKQIFSVGSGRRNLGLSLELFHARFIDNAVRADTEYAPTLDHSYIYRYRTYDSAGYSDRDSATLRVDYKYSARTRFYASLLFSQSKTDQKPGMEDMNTDLRATRNETADFAPGYDEKYSTLNNGIMQLTQGFTGFLDRQTRFQFGAEHKYSFWECDYSLAWSNSDVRLDGGGGRGTSGLQLITSMGGIDGITIDRTRDVEFATLTYAGANPAGNPLAVDNYKDFRLYRRQGTRDGTNYEAKINAKLNLDLLGHPVQFGAGLAWQQIRLAEHADTRRWRYRYHYNDAGAGSLDPDYTVAHFLASGVKIDPRLGDTITTLPRFNIGLAADDLRDHPDDWWNDEYYYLEANRDGTRDLRENIHAAYLMARTRLGPLGLLAGARAEYSRLDGRAWERTNEPLPPASERILDPAGSIAKTYGPAMQHTRPSGHRDLFPSLHLTHTLRKNLVARASWSTSIGRPPPRQFIARMTYNEGLQTVTRSNPGLAPEYGNNFDLSLEYYLKPVGLLSAGVFRKQISRFIYTSRGKIITAADPEYDPFFHGYVENTMRNGGRAAINGLELSYEQQLRFLPAPFDGLRINLNYTRMDMEANYDSGLPRTTKEVPNFVPTAFNARLRYNYRGLWCGIAYNYTDSKLLTYSDTPAYLEYRKGRGQLDLNASYRIKPFLEVFVTLNNITDEPYINCIGRKDRLYRVIYNGPNLNLGLSGRF